MTRQKNTSGGSAGAGGFNFQAAVSAIVSISVARGINLGWLKGLVNDIPTEWSAETGGAGDDIQVTFQDKSITEIQVKKGLKVGVRLWNPLIELAQAIHDKTIDYGLLIVCPNSSQIIREHLVKDIERLGNGRTDDLKPLGKTLQTKLEDLNLSIEQICNRLRIVTVHALDYDSDAIKASLAELEHICMDRSQRNIAWDKLYLDAEKLIRIKGRRTPSTIMNVLESSGIRLSTDTKEPIAIVKKITQHTLETYTSFSIFGIDQAFRLEKAWIPLEAVVQRDDSNNENKLETVLDQYHSWDIRKSSRDKYSSETVGRFIKHCVVVAGPGMGKSTLLKKLARVYSNDGVPTLFIRLPQLSARIKAGSSLEEGIFELGLANTGVTYSEIQESGIKEWTILLDGLDECDTHQKTICEELTSFAKGYPNTRVIITTRPIGYTSSLLKKDWRHYDLLPLKADYAMSHIDRLLSDIYPEESREFETAYDFAKTQLKNEKISQIISRNPFLLGLAASLFLRKTGLGDSKTDLYENLFKLIDEDKSDRVSSNNIPQPTLISFLNIIGWDLLINPIDDLESILSRCTGILNKELREPKLKALQISQGCLHYWEQAGLIEQLHFEGTKTITFIHKTFGEYAAARYIISLKEKDQALLISSQLNNQASHEAITFTASLGAENIVFTEIIKNIKSQKDKKPLLVHALKLLGICERTPNSTIVNQLLDIVFSHLQTIRKRFDVDVAETVLDICDLFPNEILSRSRKLLGHIQPWTRLSAWTFFVKTDKEKSYNLDELLKIFKETLSIDKTQATSSMKLRLPGMSGENSILSEILVIFAMKEIILKLPPKQADSIINEVLSQNIIRTISFRSSVFRVLSRYGKDKLAKPFKRQSFWDNLQLKKTIDSITEDDDVEKIANTKIFSCLNFHNKNALKKKEKPILLQLSAFLSASYYHGTYDYDWKWDYAFDLNMVTEVFKGMLGVTEIDPESFSYDIQLALNDISDDSFDLYKRTIHVDIEAEWEKAKKLELDAKKIEMALYHHSDWVVQIATNLLLNIVNHEELVNIIQRVFDKGRYTSLWAVSQICKEIGRTDLAYERLKKPLNTGCQYQYLFQVLKHTDLKRDSTLLNVINNGLMNGGALTATEAAKLAEKVATPSERKLESMLIKAYQHWQKHEEPEPSQGTIPDSPRKHILKALFLINKPNSKTMLGYCLDVRSDVRDIAIPNFIEQLSESDELKNDFLEQLVSEEIKCNFLYRAFEHPITFTSKQFEVIDRLVSHKNSNLRLAAMGILDQKDLPEEQRKIWLNKFLEDDKLEILEKAEQYSGIRCTKF